MKTTELDKLINKVVFVQMKDECLDIYALGKLYKINNENYMIISQEYKDFDLYYVKPGEFVAVDEAPEDMCPWNDDSYKDVISSQAPSIFEDFKNKFGISIENVIKGTSSSTKVSQDGLAINEDGSLINPTGGFQFL